MSNRVVYVAPDGITSATFWDDDPVGPYYLADGIDGLQNALSEVEVRGAPGQVGGSVRIVNVVERRFFMPVEIHAGGAMSDLWAARQDLASLLWVEPVRPGETATLGTLTLIREGRPDVQVACLPTNSPADEQIIAPGVGSATVEWVIPDPRWRETFDRTKSLTGTGGFEFAVEFPLEIPSFSFTLTVTNPGTVASPILVDLDGPFVDMRLTNTSTGEVIAVAGEVLAGEVLRIDTGFGRKSVTHIAADSTETSRIGQLNFPLHTSFWQLARGDNVVTFEATEAGEGVGATLTWRAMFAGV